MIFFELFNLNLIQLINYVCPNDNKEKCKRQSKNDKTDEHPKVWATISFGFVAYILTQIIA
jgi:hypothetical protein